MQSYIDSYRRYYGTTLSENKEIYWDSERFEAAATNEEHTETWSGARAVLRMYREACYRHEAEEREQDQNISRVLAESHTL